MKVAYVTTHMPFAFEEQFFEPEIRSLAGHHEVVAIPTRPRTRDICYPGLEAGAHYVGFFDLAVARMALAEVRRNPRAVAAAFASVFRPRYSLRSKAVNLLAFPKALALAHEVRRLGIDHIHCNWLTTPSTTAFVASQLTGVPWSITAHQHDIFSDNLVPEKVGSAQFVRVVSERNLRHLRERLPADLAERCGTLHLGIELPPQLPQPPARALRILCAARMCEWKGHRYLLDALGVLRDRGLVFECDLAGDGPLRPDVEGRIERLRLGRYVRLLGNIPHAQLVASLGSGAYDLAVLASTERPGEHEGIPVALMEAMAAGVPVVATRTGSITELVTAGCGELVPQRNGRALAAAIARLAADPARRRDAGERARRRVEEAFETAGTTERLAALISGAPLGPEVPADGASGTVGASAATVCSKAMHPRTSRARALTSLVLGAGIVAALSLSSIALADAPASDEYHIRANDLLSVAVYGEPNLTQAVRVLAGGTIVIPLAGEVHVGGLTPPGAATAITKSLSHYLRHPSVTVAVTEEGPVSVLVLGDVKTPGKYTLAPTSRLTDALAAAGGLGPTDGELPAVRVSAADGAVTQYSLQKLLHEGDVSQNVPMTDETTVYIASPLTLNVQVIGAVEHPGDVEVHEGDRLSMAIARAGASPTVNADLNHVEIRRVSTSGTVDTQTVNLYDVLKNNDLSKDPVLKKGDLVYVPQGIGRRDTISPFASLLFGLRGLIGL